MQTDFFKALIFHIHIHYDEFRLFEKDQSKTLDMTGPKTNNISKRLNLLVEPACFQN